MDPSKEQGRILIGGGNTDIFQLEAANILIIMFDRFAQPDLPSNAQVQREGHKSKDQCMRRRGPHMEVGLLWLLVFDQGRRQITVGAGYKC